MVNLQDCKPGDVVDIPGLFKLKVVTPMGGELPFALNPAPAHSDLTPTYKSPLYGQQSGDAFEVGNDSSPIIAGAVHVDDSAISGLELRFVGRAPIKVGGGSGTRDDFELDRGETISGIQGTSNATHVTSLTLLTNKRKLAYGNPEGAPFAWTGTEGQSVVGLSGFADAAVNGLSAIYIDAADDPPYDPTKDVNIQALPSREVILPVIQNLYNQSQYDELNQRRAAFKSNMEKIYIYITNMLNAGQNPWSEVIHVESGKMILTYANNVPNNCSVYIYATQGSAPLSDQVNITIGQVDSTSGWTDMTNYIIRGAVDLATWRSVAWGFARFFGDYLLKKGAQFIGSALDVLASRLIATGALRSTARMFASLAGGALLRSFQIGLDIFGEFIGVLVAYGIDALIAFLMRTYYMSIRIYNHDSRLVDWTASSYYGYNESIAGNVEWEVQVVPSLVAPGTSEWIEGIGYVTSDSYVGSYNCYAFENQNYGAGVAVAMTANRPGTSDSVNLMYRVAKGANNSMGLNWGNQSDQNYLNSGKDQQVNHLSIDTPVKVISLSPTLWKDPKNAYSYAVFLGQLPPARSP